MMAAAALLFVPCTALRRIYEYVIHTYLTFYLKLLVLFLAHLPELPCLRYMTLTDMQLSSHQQQKNSKQQTASSVHRLPTCDVRYMYVPPAHYSALGRIHFLNRQHQVPGGVLRRIGEQVLDHLLRRTYLCTYRPQLGSKNTCR